MLQFDTTEFVKEITNKFTYIIDRKIIAIKELRDDNINYHLRSKSLIGKHYRHDPYVEGANMYVSKYICDYKTNWSISKNPC